MSGSVGNGANSAARSPKQEVGDWKDRLLGCVKQQLDVLIKQEFSNVGIGAIPIRLKLDVPDLRMRTAFIPQ